MSQFLKMLFHSLLLLFFFPSPPLSSCSPILSPSPFSYLLLLIRFVLLPHFSSFVLFPLFLSPPSPSSLSYLSIIFCVFGTGGGFQSLHIELHLQPFFWNNVLLNYQVAQAGLKLLIFWPQLSRMLGLQSWATVPGLSIYNWTVSLGEF